MPRMHYSEVRRFNIRHPRLSLTVALRGEGPRPAGALAIDSICLRSRDSSAIVDVGKKDKGVLAREEAKATLFG
jgi:hypothetical protein